MQDYSSLVSIVMLNYNGLEYLKKTIPSIMDLDYPNLEFIVVDNGSADGSIDFIKKFKKIKLINSPKIGEKNFACNYAICRAKGEYILLIDNDIIVKEKKIIYNLINNYLNLDRAGTITLAYMDNSEKLSKGYGGFFGYYFSVENPYLTREQIYKMNNIVIGCPAGVGLFIKSSLWAEIGGYDESLKFGGDDNDLGIRVTLKGLNNYLYSETIQTHIGNINKNKSNSDYEVRWKLLVQSYLYTITKNYNIYNLSISIVVFSVFAFIKSIKQSIFRLHLGPIFSFFHGYYLFIKMLPITLKKREDIQLKRVIKEDIFLKIRPPKFN